MTASRRVPAGLLAAAVLPLVHALLTWPLRETLVLYVGGGLLAFVAEATVVRLGLLRHHVVPRVTGVPMVVVLAWPSTVYAAVRVVAPLLPPGQVPFGAAVLATAVDVLLDPRGLDSGLWSYPDRPISRVRYRGVPWWNFAGWLVVVFLTATLTTLV